MPVCIFKIASLAHLRDLLLALTLLTLAVSTAAQPAAEHTLQVLHWWTSASERKAASILAAKIQEEGLLWRDAGIPGGAGIGASKVLKSRVLAGNAPDVTQIIGVSIREWADLGFLLELDKIAQTQRWQQILFPSIYQLIQHRQHIVAAPLGLHRINTLFYNRRLFQRHHLNLPVTWQQFQQTAHTFRQAGITPLALSSEPWQVATLFENLVLLSSNAEFHRQLFSQLLPQAAFDPRFALALQRLRQIKGWSNVAPEERSWPEVTRQFQKQEAAMLVMGDWAKAELKETGWVLDEDFACVAMPGTAPYHLYSVDTLVMFTNDYARSFAQEKFAKAMLQSGLQSDYNQAKGSIPVRKDADLSKLDSCAQNSWQTFAKGQLYQAPSLVHRMATEESSRDAIIAVIHRYFIDDRISIQETQKKIAAIFRNFSTPARSG